MTVTLCRPPTTVSAKSTRRSPTLLAAGVCAYHSRGPMVPLREIAAAVVAGDATGALGMRDSSPARRCNEWYESGGFQFHCPQDFGHEGWHRNVQVTVTASPI